MSALNAIILAAGRGTRMKSETAKVLHQICGRPMIHIALDIATSVGVKQPLVVLSKDAQDIKAQLPKDAKIVIQSQPLGTGDAVLAAKRLLGSLAGDLLILYADTPLLRRSTVHPATSAEDKGPVMRITSSPARARAEASSAFAMPAPCPTRPATGSMMRILMVHLPW